MNIILCVYGVLNIIILFSSIMGAVKAFSENNKIYQYKGLQKIKYYLFMIFHLTPRFILISFFGCFYVIYLLIEKSKSQR